VVVAGVVIAEVAAEAVAAATGVEAILEEAVARAEGTHPQDQAVVTYQA